MQWGRFQNIGRGIHQFDRDIHLFVAGKHKLGETGQQGHGTTEPAPLGSIDIAFLTPMNIERSNQRCALTAIIVQAQQLETSIVLGTQVSLYLIFIAEGLQLATGHQELLSLGCHAVVCQQVAEHLKVTGLIRPLILRHLLEIGESAPLALLVGDNRRLVGYAVTIVAREFDATIVVIIAAWRMAVPVQATCATLHMVLRAIVPGPSTSDRGSSIDLGGVILLHLLHPVVAVADPVASRFVACCHHDKRGMMPIGIENALRLVQQILVYLLSATQLHAMVWPRRSFGLQIDTHLIGSTEGSIRGTIAVETDMVDAILLTLAENTQPLSLVGRGITRFWEEAVLHRATQEQRIAVDIELAPLDGDVAQTEQFLIDSRARLDSQLVEFRMELIPQLHITF